MSRAAALLFLVLLACTTTIISRNPYEARTTDCGRCGCTDSAKSGQHSYGTPWTNTLGMLRKNCHGCGRESPA